MKPGLGSASGLVVRVIVKVRVQVRVRVRVRIEIRTRPRNLCFGEDPSHVFRQIFFETFSKRISR